MTLSRLLFADHSIDFVVMDVAVNAAAGALKAFFADLPEPLIPYSLHPELVEAASKDERYARDSSSLSCSPLSSLCSGLASDPRLSGSAMMICSFYPQF